MQLDEALFIGVALRSFRSTLFDPRLNNYQLKGKADQTTGQETRSFFQRLKPFIGGGVGGATVFGEFDDSFVRIRPSPKFEDEGNDTVLTYYGKAGIAYEISEHWALGLQYRIWGLPKGFSIDDTETDDVLSHAFGLVLRAEF